MPPVRGWGLDSEQRLTALAGVEVVAGVPEPAFDPYTRLVSRVLDVPVALVSFVTAHRQIFASSVGLAEPWASAGETPLDMSFCQHVVTGDQPLIVVDAAQDERVRANRAIDQLGVQAYLGVPLRAPTGEPLGSLCAIDNQPREWTDQQLAALEDVADAAAAAIALRISEHRQRTYAHDASHRLRTPITALRLELEDMAMSASDHLELDDGLRAAGERLDDVTRIVDDLLIAAGSQARERFTDVHLVDLATSVVAQWRPTARELGRDIVQSAGAPVTVQTIAPAVRRVLDLLIEHALVSGGGTVGVHVLADGELSRVRVTTGVADDAPDLHSDEIVLATEVAAGIGGRIGTVRGARGTVELLLPRHV